MPLREQLHLVKGEREAGHRREPEREKWKTRELARVSCPLRPRGWWFVRPAKAVEEKSMD